MFVTRRATEATKCGNTAVHSERRSGFGAAEMNVGELFLVQNRRFPALLHHFLS